MIEASAAQVRATIARAWLASSGAESDPSRPDVSSPASPASVATSAPVLGAVTLRPHQRDAARRLTTALRTFGGALLADEVGLGKTYTALAVAASARRPLVVAPASLRDMWRAALHATGVRADFVSFERLSRARAESPGRHPSPFDLLVVDEAHHARNPATRRYRALAELAEHARVLLLSATPIHNRRADLDALLALFLGARARTLDDPGLARIVVRRDRSALADGDGGARVPGVAPLRWLRPPADDAVLDRILSIPPPLPPRDGGDGGALVAHGLVRQWASSDAALRAALARRLAAAGALIDALSIGRYPEAKDLAAWVAGADAVQLPLTELLVAPALVGDGTGALAEMLAAVRAHERAVRSLDNRLRAARGGAADDARADLLVDIVERHRGAKVVAFASYAETVTAYFRRLRHRARVAALSGGGATVAGGRITRRDALARFAPEASGVAAPRPADCVDLLLATDLLSEGVNLQDASVVVHLDLPWTSARLEQRVGRAARLGSRHDVVHVYAMAPPATAERVLAVEVRLRAKAHLAGGSIGAAFTSPFLTDSTAATRAPPIDAERVRAMLREWRANAAHLGSVDSTDEAPTVAAVRAPRDGFLALCTVGDGAGELGPRAPLLLVSLDGAPPTDRPRAVLDAVALAAGEETSVDRAGAAAALAAVERWADARSAARDAGADVVAGLAAVRRRLLDRIAAVARRAPPHGRARVARLCHDARRAALLRLGVAGERRLTELAAATLPDDAWIRAVLDFARDHQRSSEPGHDRTWRGDGDVDQWRPPSPRPSVARVSALLQLIAAP